MKKKINKEEEEEEEKEKWLIDIRKYDRFFFF